MTEVEQLKTPEEEVPKQPETTPKPMPPTRKPRSDKGTPHKKKEEKIIELEIVTPKKEEQTKEVKVRPVPKTPKKEDNTYAYALLVVTLVLTAVVAYIFFIKPKLQSDENGN